MTDKGKGLLPIMLAVIGWFEKYDPETDVSREFAERVRLTHWASSMRRWMQ